MMPPDSSLAASASSQDAGLPILIAVAIVCGCSTGRPITIGAAPLAWKPTIPGGRETRLAPDSERGVLRALQPVRVDRVDQGHRVLGGQLPGQLKAVVERAVDLQQL